MKAIIKKVNKKPIIVETDDSFKLLNEVFKDRDFDCYQGYSHTKGFDIYVDDCGYGTLGLNFYTYSQALYGTAVFFGYDGKENNISLNKSQISFIKKHFNQRL